MGRGREVWAVLLLLGWGVGVGGGFVDVMVGVAAIAEGGGREEAVVVIAVVVVVVAAEVGVVACSSRGRGFVE